MNFFNSIFSNDPQPSDGPNSPQSLRTSPESENPCSPNANANPNSTSASAWNFGELIKTIATRSESVIGNYKRDIEEFGSGLLKETVVIREVASRTVKEFPDSIDVGAAVAQESLESVGQVIDNLGSSVWQNTAKFIARGTELHLFEDEGDGYVNGSDDDRGLLGEGSLSVGKYSRLDLRMREIQCNSRTYSEEPEDLDDYQEWKLGFALDEKAEEIENLISENRVIERIHLELVPVMVDHEMFWSRYFYKVYKLQQAEEARMRIEKRAITGDDEEEWSWDVDDDDSEGKTHVDESEEKGGDVGGESNLGEISLERDYEDHGLLEPSSSADQTIDEMELKRVWDALSETNADQTIEGMVSDGKVDNGESCKDSDVSVVSTQPSLPEEEELGWDEIEDIGSDDENRTAATTAGASSDISELHKRLTAREEEEVLSWDIEDGDEPMNS